MLSEKTYLENLQTERFGRNAVFLGETDSTTQYILDNDPDIYTCVTAERQTAGRGRSGRTWHSDDSGNLYFSLNLPPIDVSKILPLNIAAGFALSDTLSTVVPAKVKWPNDITVHGRKVAGMLMETSVTGARLDKLILGIGINVNMQVFPEDITETATSLFILTGRSFSREKLLALFMKNMERIWEDFTNGRLDIETKWKEYSANLDKRITVHKNGKRETFTELGLAPAGFLRVRDDSGGVSEIVTGDIGYDFSD
ncbi:biotin--[acetyl-CoA-carboxylase] ligase [Limisalsivibrio acetivorans]|uniref:biotin--[acetyl-CoA-carboxylase] ligase n=1 Tax=Limisalsivibrio acetivorans TaxID=1304888 RepID=UPI0003B33F84|nr:biotin--[acetyl-CoA-carboxylase] ligase [Limisalsivibrio acetivorans]